MFLFPLYYKRITDSERVCEIIRLHTLGLQTNHTAQELCDFFGSQNLSNGLGITDLEHAYDIFQKDVCFIRLLSVKHV